MHIRSPKKKKPINEIQVDIKIKSLNKQNKL